MPTKLTRLLRYFFSSNSGVDGCASKREPGYEHMEWLRIQLENFRERGMKAILMGHVPPARVDSKESWDETCWQKYTLWGRQFRDVIVGSLYGHMNIDHFMLQDFEHISKDAQKGRMASGGTASKFEQDVAFLKDGEVTAASASDYLISLRKAWAKLPVPPAKSKQASHARSTGDEDDEEEKETPWWSWLVSRFLKIEKDDSNRKSRKRDYLDKIGGKYAERYAISHVAPSVVPNYFPSLRIIEYNISGLENLKVSTAQTTQPSFKPSEQHPVADIAFSDDEAYAREVDTVLKHKKKHKNRKKKGAKKYKFHIPEGPSKSTPPGPAYSPQPLTWMRFTQYFANLTHINNDFVESQQESVATPAISSNDKAARTIFGLHMESNGTLEQNKWKEGKHGKHQGKRPRPEPHPNEFKFEVEYDTQEDEGFTDLTVRRWVEYARKIGQAGRKRSLWGSREDDGDGDGDDDDDDDYDFTTKDGYFRTQKREGKHKHKHNKGKRHASKAWFTFVQRAFVGSMDPEALEDLFAVAQEESGEYGREREREREIQEGIEL